MSLLAVGTKHRHFVVTVKWPMNSGNNGHSWHRSLTDPTICLRCLDSHPVLPYLCVVIAEMVANSSYNILVDAYRDVLFLG